MRTLLLAVLLLLAGCDQIKERAGFPEPARVEAEGKAIGGACRHAGRGLEDCYRLNPEASKSAIYTGWKEMTEYMAKNNIEAVEPVTLPEALVPAKPPAKKKSKKADGEEGAPPAPASKKDAGH
ncbi:MAG: hypothetical protein Q8Q28_14700 [Pseudomonadota bacterium]|nr:hypothetical protein [Pseudomonadota bacterium]